MNFLMSNSPRPVTLSVLKTTQQPVLEQKPLLVPGGLRYSQQLSPEKLQKDIKYSKPIDDDKEKKQSNVKNLKTLCYYHPNQIITNFCSNSECLMPLCPVCIDIHQREHNAKQELSTFEPIEFVQSKCLSEILNLIENTKNLSLVLKSVQSKYEQQNSVLKEKIAFFKMQILQILDQFFDSFAKQILDDCYQSEKAFANSAKFVSQQLDSIMHELIESKEEILMPEKMLKIIIQFQSTNYCDQTKSYLSKKQNELLIAQESMIEAKIDETKLSHIPELAPVQKDPEVQSNHILQQEMPIKQKSQKKSEFDKQSFIEQSNFYSPKQSIQETIKETKKNAQQSPQLPHFTQFEPQQPYQQQKNSFNYQQQRPQPPQQPPQEYYNYQSQQIRPQFQDYQPQQQKSPNYYQQQRQYPMQIPPQQQQQQMQMMKSPSFFQEQNYPMPTQQQSMKYQQEMPMYAQQQWGMREGKKSFDPYHNQYQNSQYFQ